LRLAAGSRAARTPVFTVLLLSGCFDCGPDPDPPPSTSTAAPTINVKPVSVYAHPGATFEMRARVFEADGYPLGELDAASQVEWMPATATVKVTPVPGWPQRATLAVGAANQFTAFPDTIQIVARVQAHPAVTATFFVVVFDDAVAGAQDVVRSPVSGVSLPSVAILDGIDGLGTHNDSLVAFVGEGLLGDFQGGGTTVNLGSGSITVGAAAAVMATDHRMAVGPRTWQASRDVVEYHDGSGTPPDAPYTIPVEVWNASGAVWDDPVSATALDVELATATLLGITNAIHRDSRTGIRFTIDPTPTDLGAAPISDAKQSCTDPSNEPVLNQPGSPVPLDVAVLHVVWVTDLKTSGGFTYAGWSCEPGSVPAAIIFMNWGSYMSGTLAHEFGHSLGLRDPDTHTGTDGVGHVFYIQPANAFDAGNLMAFGAPATKNYARHYLTLGQGYRMNVHLQSWLNLGHDLSQTPSVPIRAHQPNAPPNQALPCGGNASSTSPCPALWLDSDG
jgi:hypothetical protein